MDSTLKNSARLVGIELGAAGMNAVSLKSDGTLAESIEESIDSGEDTSVHLGKFIRDLKVKFGPFENLGMAVPGLVNRETSRVAYSTHNPAHAKIDLHGEIEKAAGVKLHIENDANAAAYGEYHLGAGRGSKNMFYVTLGTGVGGAVIFEDKLWHGDSGFAGEFGYMAINSEGMRLEELASAAGILKRTKGRFHQDPTSSLTAIGEDNITIEDLVREAKRDDDFAQLMLDRTGFYVGTAIAGVINLLNIERIVIGGEIMEAGRCILDPIIQRARELSFAPSFETVEIVRGGLGKNAAAIGAALLSDR